MHALPNSDSDLAKYSMNEASRGLSATAELLVIKCAAAGSETRSNQLHFGIELSGSDYFFVFFLLLVINSASMLLFTRCQHYNVDEFHNIL